MTPRISIQTGWQQILKGMKASGDRQELQFAPLEPKFVPSFSDSEEVDDAAEEDGKKRESQSQDDTAHAAKRVKGEKPTSMQDQSSEVKGEQDEVEEVEPTFEQALEAEVEHFLQKGDEEAALSGSPSFVSDNEEVKEMRPTMKVVLLRGKGLVSLENVVQYALYKAGLYKYYVDRCVRKTLEALDFEELTALIEQAKKHSQLMSFMKQTHQREDVPDDWIHCFGSAQETAGDELRFLWCGLPMIRWKPWMARIPWMLKLLWKRQGPLQALQALKFQKQPLLRDPMSQRSRLRSQKLPRMARIPRVLKLLWKRQGPLQALQALKFQKQPLLRDRLSQRSRRRSQKLHMILNLQFLHNQMRQRKHVPGQVPLRFRLTPHLRPQLPLRRKTRKCSEVQGDVAPKEPVNPKKMEKGRGG